MEFRVLLGVRELVLAARIAAALERIAVAHEKLGIPDDSDQQAQVDALEQKLKAANDRLEAQTHDAPSA